MSKLFPHVSITLEESQAFKIDTTAELANGDFARKNTEDSSQVLPDQEQLASIKISMLPPHANSKTCTYN